ncbi:unnamed protein product (macronuclear) [Paramecium tetraurelia]|uniref:PB1 domain-containing protein n=1 Tax=Paramecium tetraurelia TaxID=5888 RepID=A0DAB7_PARTE|nr:uncharacterized protein GSPATT00014891001 [Paramecium tetraurelia]CAK79984.1 unnamed protein product [Paramecium tetraurelia]|eukprot:XP_001447381.1 hypothetical protein (macronuclear) [Paramecium tetraurelia strain d4-2]
MDIKIITQSDTFLIYKEIQTLSDLKKEIKRIGIQTRDIIIYFYDNDSDKVVIIQDEDLQYAYQQSKAFKKQSIKLYIYYKLSQPKILQLEPSIKISTQQAQQDWIFKSINENSSQSLTNSNEIQTYCQNRYTIVPEPLKTREEKLKSAIDFFIDQILKEEYQI